MSIPTIRVFISSPGDVAEERRKARQVIATLQKQYSEAVQLLPVMWEDLAIPATASLQEGIDRLLQEWHRIDIAVFILWSRLGQPVGGALTRKDGSPYRSGTEREFEMMLALYEQSGGRRPVILAYAREDDEAFSRHLDLRTHDEEKLEDMLRQRRMVKEFIKEKFLDEQGRSLRAYHIYRDPVGFAQRLHAHLRGVLLELSSDREPPAAWTEAPYRGLEVFEVEHAPVFCGRDEETCSLLQRLRERQKEGNAFVCILGASGSGKSSLARAGVAAALVERSFDDGVAEWRTAIFAPSGTPGDLFAGLAGALGVALPSLGTGPGGVERFARCLAQGNEEAVSILLAAAAAAEERKICGPLRILLLVDQMEELWTEGWIAPEQREEFLRIIACLASDARCAVLGTLRSDFYSQAQTSETFLRLKGERGQFDLRAPGTGALQQIITQPAQRAGLRFEQDPDTGRSLDQSILEDAARDPAVLPLLQYSLFELHARQDGAPGVLTFSSYRAMGGVEGALTKRAEELFASLPDDARGALPEVMPLLVSVEGSAKRQTAVRRAAPVTELVSTPARLKLFAEMVRARFLSVGAETAMLSHEALLKKWDRVREWIETNQARLRQRSRIEKYHAIWEESGRERSALLPAGRALQEGKDLLQNDGSMLDAACRQYVAASLARHQSALWRVAAVLAVLLLASGAALFAYWNHARPRTEYYAELSESFGVPRGVEPLDASRAARRSGTYRAVWSRGRLRSTSRVNGAGQPCPDPAAPFEAATREMEYREDGSLQAVTFRAANGRLLATFLVSPVRPPERAGGWSETTVEVRSPRRDSALTPNGRLAGLAAENPMAVGFSEAQQRPEISTMRISYSPEGRPVRKIFYNVFGMPRADANGSFGVAMEYDHRGLLIRKTSLDSEGAPSVGRGGVQSVCFERDARGAIVAISHFGEDGRPVRNAEGWHREEISCDRHGNQIEARFFDEARQPVRHKDGYFRMVMSLDEWGNVVATEFRGEHGEQACGQTGEAKWTADYDAKGRRIRMGFYDASGRLFTVPPGHAEWRAEYDERGNLIKVSDFGAEGRPVLTGEGIAGVNYVVDAEGRNVRTSAFGVDGRPCLFPSGVCGWATEYDERGNATQNTFFGLNGEPVMHSNGYVRWIAQYDERGNKLETRYFGLDGRPSMNSDGYATYRSLFDAQGNEISVAFFGIDGEPALHTDGYAKWTAQYDECGNKISTDFFGVDGAPVAIRNGHSGWRARYNDRGQRTEMAYIGPNGEPAPGPDGWSREVVDYDEHTGAEKRRTQLDCQGNALAKSI